MTTGYSEGSRLRVSETEHGCFEIERVPVNVGDPFKIPKQLVCPLLRPRAPGGGRGR